MINISVKDNFSEYPGLRHCSTSEKSGEDFYHTVLNKVFSEAFLKKEKLSVNIDGTDGYASSFLDEAFGNLVFDFTLDIVKQSLIIISNEEPHWKNMLETKTFNEWEHRRINQIRPIVTIEHEAWNRLIEKELVSSIWEKPNLEQ